METRTRDPIRRLRERLGLSQGEFGALLGVSQARVSDWERGAALSGPSAVALWERHGKRLAGMRCGLIDLLRERPAGKRAA